MTARLKPFWGLQLAPQLHQSDAAPIADYEPPTADDILFIDLETLDRPTGLEMFEVQQFLETENSSANNTGSGSEVGILSHQSLIMNQLWLNLPVQ